MLEMECHWYDDCEFRYAGMHMRADGASILLKFPAGAGLTYQFSAALRADSLAAHLRLAIFPPEAIGTSSASNTGSASQSNCVLPPTAARTLDSTDVTEMKLGNWGGSLEHGQTWGQRAGCPESTRVGPPEEDGGCDGEYRYFPGSAMLTKPFWCTQSLFGQRFMFAGGISAWLLGPAGSEVRSGTAVTGGCPGCRGRADSVWGPCTLQS